MLPRQNLPSDTYHHHPDRGKPFISRKAGQKETMLYCVAETNKKGLTYQLQEGLVFRLFNRYALHYKDEIKFL